MKQSHVANTKREKYAQDVVDATWLVEVGVINPICAFECMYGFVHEPFVLHIVKGHDYFYKVAVIWFVARSYVHTLNFVVQDELMKGVEGL